MEYSDRSFGVTFFLCFFFGGLGFHRFYTGKVGTGFLMMFTLGGLGIWTIIDFIMICLKNFKDSQGKIIK